MANGPDLTGEKFTYLTVQRFSHKDKHRRKIWECQCDCGGIRFIATSDLRSGNSKSCGCKATELRGEKVGEIWSSYWKRYQYEAKQRNLEFDLNIEDAWQLFEEQGRKCALSGIDLVFGKRYTKDETTASLDRINSSKGYTLSNVQCVHKEVNRMKGQLTDHEFRTWCSLCSNH